MKVSIITATFNSEKYLSDCINSVKKQSYYNIEHIVVDGKSTDATIDIIRENEDHLAMWISETDRGMYDAINKGISMATGDIIGILNSDDMFASPYVIRNIVDCFKRSGSDSVYGDLMFVNPRHVHRVSRIWKGKSYKRSRFRYGWMPAHPTFYMKRHLVEQFGKYENHYYSAADYEFMSRYLYRHKISATYLEQMVVKMRTGGASNGSLKKWLRANRRDYLAMKQNKIPFSFIVSILKPIIKIRQFKSIFKKQIKETAEIKQPTISFFPPEGKSLPHVEIFK